MSSMPVRAEESHPGYAYHLLKVALNSFHKHPRLLDVMELQRARGKADKSYALESLVLATPEAVDVVVGTSQLDDAMAKIASRYENTEQFHDDLAQSGIDETSLREALRRELVFDGVMQRVGTKAPQVDDLDVRLFYELHRDGFSVPEQRMARHILITINPDYLENTSAVALARAEKLASKLHGKPNRFASLARQHSECPTALEGGKLGTLKRGTLFPELDAVLFALPEGGISDAVETEIGFHIIWCEKIVPAKFIPLSKARPRIEQVLAERKRRNCQKNWLAQLQRATCGDKELS